MGQNKGMRRSSEHYQLNDKSAQCKVPVQGVSALRACQAARSSLEAKKPFGTFTSEGE